MELIPADYRCADHDEDLTLLVRDELEDAVPTSYRIDDSFRVIVTCPGGGQPHDVGCSGRYVGRGR